jgi:hypothetical protein
MNWNKCESVSTPFRGGGIPCLSEKRIERLDTGLLKVRGSSKYEWGGVVLFPVGDFKRTRAGEQKIH